MKVSIQEHHDEEEIQIIRFSTDIKYWLAELDFLNKEIDFYLNLLNSPLIVKGHMSSRDNNLLTGQLIELKESNNIHRRSCTEFQIQLEGQKECDEIECDYAFIRAHHTFRSKIENHIEEIRNLKQSAFIYLRNAMS